MPKNDDLFELIKSLNKSEKRYFKIYSEKHVIGNENKYVQLFEAIEKQNNYNGKKISDKLFSGQSLASFSVAKSYLHNLLLRSMASYHSGSSIDIKLSEYLAHVEFLYNKRLFAQCLKLIKKAKKKSYEYNEIVHTLGFLWWQRAIFNETAFKDKSEEEVKNIYQEESLLIKKLWNSRKIETLFSEFYFRYTHQGIARNIEEVEMYKKMINHPLLEKVENALSFNAKNNFYNTHSFYCRATNDTENQYVFDKKRVELIEADPKFIDVYIHTYIDALQNLISATSMLLKQDEFNRHLLKLISIKLKSDNLKIKVFGFVNNILMLNYSKTGDFKNSLPFLKQLEEGLEKYDEKIDQQSQLMFNYNIAYFYFVLGDYTKSLYRINKVIHNSTNDLRYEIQSLARIMNLILHYELNNQFLLEYMIKSTYRFLSKRNKLYQMENFILGYIRKSANLNDQFKINDSFKTLKTNLETIATEPAEKMLLENLDLISWLDAKINKVSFEQAFKENIIKKAGNQLNITN
ncbi:MAG: hypothetical protein H0X62_03515 [Bacteroidetes bacterium]|nr:hypothetical protein [Bacteroidota bacterium]